MYYYVPRTNHETMNREFVITPAITTRDCRSITDLLRDAARYPLLTVDEEVELATKSAAGDLAARELLVNSNIRFLISVAKQYEGRYGACLSDLLSEGYIGMLTAASRFDVTVGCKFISYAVWHIRQKIEQYLMENGQMVRVPQNKMVQLRRVRRIAQRFEQANGRRPDSSEIADILSEGDAPFDASQVQTLLTAANPVIEADAPIRDEEDSPSFLDSIPSGDHADDHLLDESRRETIGRLLATLSERDALILRQTYGLEGTEACTLTEISEQTGLSKERVRQIRNHVLNNLRKGPFASVLRSLL